MAIAVVPCATVEETVAALAPINHYFGRIPILEDSGRITNVLPPDRMFSAREDDRVVGGAGSFPFELTVPGGTVRAAGTTVVGVAPTHRRRGILRSLMRAQLDDVHVRQEPVACLWASEETIYGRFGYGMASWGVDLVAPKPAAFHHSSPPASGLRILPEAEALSPIAEVYDQVRRTRPGMYHRTTEWWTTRLLADPEARRVGGVLNRAVLFRDGTAEAYALYRLNQDFQGGVSVGNLHVIEALGTSPRATREIWRFLLDIDWVAEIRAFFLPVDHPLLLQLARPRAAHFRVKDVLWVRLVDVATALRARRRNPGASVVLEVADAFCPWNAGRYRVSAEGVETTAEPADLALEASALGAVYLGGFDFHQLAAAERVAELVPGAIERADLVFHTATAPWCPEIF